MRKIIASEFISLDGVIESANQLTARYFNDELGQALQAQISGSDTLLLGRVTYQEFLPFWADKAGTDDPVAAHMSKPKLVLSTTLNDTSEWRDSTVISGNAAEQIGSLKERPGKNILVIGSATVVRWLLREGLLDDLELLMCPIVVGRGKRLFDDEGEQVPLTLTGSEAFSTGVVHLNYQRA